MISSKHRKTLIKSYTHLGMVHTGMTSTLTSAKWKAIEWVTAVEISEARFTHYARKRKAKKPPSLTLLSLTMPKIKPSTKSRVVRTPAHQQHYGLRLQSSLRLQVQRGWKKLASILMTKKRLKSWVNGLTPTPAFLSRDHWRKDWKNSERK